MTEPNSVSSNDSTGGKQPETDDPPIDALTGDNWGQAADDILEQSSFDSELGKRMSRDAIRASRGEMSEEEFYEKYHSKVMEEFGVDKRPIPTGEKDD